MMNSLNSLLLGLVRSSNDEFFVAGLGQVQ